MWKKRSRIASVFLLAMLLLSLCATALAIDPMLPSSAIEGGYSLQVNFTTGGKPLEVANGVAMRMYKVATMVDAFAEFAYTDDFAPMASEINLNKQTTESWKAAVPVLAKFAEENGLKPYQERVVQTGGVRFRPLPAGLYLLVFDRCLEEYRYFEMNPQLVSVPNRRPDSEEWIYNVVIEKKVEGNDRTDLIDITVRKKWDDVGWAYNRPENITITLYADGKEKETITLPRKSGSKEYWDYTWTKLDPAVKWTVEETKPANYTPQYDPPKGKLKKISATKYEVEITNYRPPKPPEPNLPQTGLNWWPVAMLAVSGMVLVFLGWLARRADEESEEA